MLLDTCVMAEFFKPLDAETSRLWGELSARAQNRGRPLAVVDGLIAATALRHGMHVMTRNERDFEESGVGIVNPWRVESIRLLARSPQTSRLETNGGSHAWDALD